MSRVLFVVKRQYLTKNILTTAETAEFYNYRSLSNQKLNNFLTKFILNTHLN